MLYKFVLRIDSLNPTWDKNKNEKDDSQKDTSQKIQTSSDSEKQALVCSEPEPLAENKEQIPKVEGEERFTPKPDDGKSCFHFQDPNNNHMLRHVILLVDFQLLPCSRCLLFPFILKISSICNCIHEHQMARRAGLLHDTESSTQRWLPLLPTWRILTEDGLAVCRFFCTT